VIGAGRAVISVMQGDTARAIPQAQAALDGLADSDLRARSIAGIALGLAHLSQEAASQAAEAFRGVAAVNRAMHFGLFMMLAAVGEACAHRMAGALDTANATYEQGIEWCTAHAHPFLLEGSLYTGLADVLRERHELEAALDRATYGIRRSTELGAAQAERWIEWHVCNMLVLARIRQAQGELAGALASVHEAQDMLKSLGASAFVAILAAFEAQIHLAQGDVAAAVRWLRSVEAHAAPPRFGLTPQFFVYATEHLEIAPVQVLIAQGRATGDPASLRLALARLDELRVKAERSDLAWLHSKTLALQALAYQALGEMAPALAALDQALTLAQAERYIHLFVDEGPPMADLLRRLRTHGTAPEHLAAVLAALDTRPPEDALPAPGRRAGEPLTHPLTEALTERELDVLRLMAAGQSNPEIAHALCVEVNTVKTHVKSLFGKLGVHSRMHAARRAQELGLL
jgi:LuxR family maltose regulon positive regulatory protein